MSDYGMFEEIYMDKTAQDKANKASLAVARKRVSDHFGHFLHQANTKDEFATRLELAESDIRQAIHAACDEYGGNHEMIYNIVVSEFVPFEKGQNSHDKKEKSEEKDDDEEEEENAKHSSESQENVTCFNCGGSVNKNGNCKECGQYNVPGKGMTDKEASVKESRRPKLCPYHSEVMDVSLAAGDPQAGYNAMAQHAWGPKHCQGEFDGS